MVNLTPMFQDFATGVMNGDTRYTHVKPEHIDDTKTGVRYHLYSNKPFEISVNDELVLVGTQLSNSEAALLEKVRLYSTEVNRGKLAEILTV